MAAWDFGLTQNMPFVLSSPGHYDVVLNAFFRKLPFMRVPAPNSWRTYASKLIPVARFIVESCGRPSLAAGTLDDFMACKSTRRDRSRPEVSARSWNVTVAAIEKFFHFAVVNGHVASSPFWYRLTGMVIAGVVQERSVNAQYTGEDLDRAKAEGRTGALCLQISGEPFASEKKELLHVLHTRRQVRQKFALSPSSSGSSCCT